MRVCVATTPFALGHHGSSPAVQTTGWGRGPGRWHLPLCCCRTGFLPAGLMAQTHGLFQANQLDAATPATGSEPACSVDASSFSLDGSTFFFVMCFQ